MAEERGGASNKSELKKALQKKIDYILRKPKISPVEAYNLVKRFFQAFTGNEYEFTREELVSELDKVYLEEDKKLRMQEIVERLGEIEFSQPQYSQEELKSLLQEFGDIVDGMVHEEHVDLGLWDKIAKKFKSKAKKEENAEEGEKSSIEKFMEEVEETGGANVEEGPGLYNPDDYQDSTPGPEVERMEEAPTPQPEEASEEPPTPEKNVLKQAPEPTNQDLKEESPPWAVPAHKESKENVTEEILLDTEFDKVLEEFHENLDKGNVIMAKLDYEEMKHAYDKMSTKDQHEHYDKLKKAHEKLDAVMKN